MSVVYFGNASGSDDTGVAGNFAYFFQATCTQSGNVTDGRIGYSSGGGSAKMAVYTVAAGLPGTLLGESNALALSGPAGVKQLVFGTPFAVVNGTGYFLAWLFSTATTLLSTAGGSYYYKASTYPAFPSPVASPGSSAGFVPVLQAGVTAAAAAAFVPLIAVVG